MNVLGICVFVCFIPSSNFSDYNSPNLCQMLSKYLLSECVLMSKQRVGLLRKA